MATGRCAVVQLGTAAKRYCWLNIVDYSRSPSTEKIRQTSRGNVRDFNTGNVLLARARTGWARSPLDFRATLFMHAPRPRKLFANANFLTYCPIILVHVAKQVVKVIWHRAASPPNTDGFSRIRHVALMCNSITPICVRTVYQFYHCWVTLSISTAGNVVARTFFAFTIVISRVGIWTPSSDMVPWAHPSQYSEQHRDRFSRFCKAHGHDRPTDDARPSVAIGRIYR